MTTPDTLEPVCAYEWCGKPESDRQHLSVGDLLNPYMSHHPFKPTEAPAPAAPSASQPEEAVPGAAEAAIVFAFDEWYNVGYLSIDEENRVYAAFKGGYAAGQAVRAEPVEEVGND